MTAWHEGRSYIPDDPERELWDVIVVGTGMGGATFGYALAREGYRVLFLEKGLLQDTRGGHPPGGIETDEEGEPDFRLMHGRWPLPLTGSTSFGPTSFFAPWGCGGGGSTAIYAAALERFEPIDLTPRENYPEPAGNTLPEAWPISYGELEPYYERAEELFRVRGTPDPLSRSGAPHLMDPPDLGPRDKHLEESWTALGLHPYRLHVGCDYVAGCGECAGTLCFRNCKSDAKRICLLPALHDWGASVLSECEVLSLETTGDRVDAVRARWKGRELRLRGHIVALGAGAWMTPVILLRSRSRTGSAGLANSSGLVGRNLMLHASDYVAVEPLAPLPGSVPSKSLALNDFYFADGKKLGTFQSAGGSISAESVAWFLGRRLDRDPRRWHPLVRPRLPAFARLAARFFRNSAVCTTIVEDLPYHQNRVVPDPTHANGMRFEYTYPDELRDRCKLLMRKLKTALQPHRTIRITGANNLNFGHVCGTCRFGNDPGASVLNRDNRAHDVTNLYVVDASFFPSSGGTNPSLTIAANALRVAASIDGRPEATSLANATRSGAGRADRQAPNVGDPSAAP